MGYKPDIKDDSVSADADSGRLGSEASFGVILLDTSGRIDELRPEVAALLGHQACDSQAISDAGVAKVFQHIPDVMAAVAPYLRSPERLSLDMCGLDVCGKQLNIRIRSVVAGIVISIEDITGDTDLQNALKSAKDQAEAANRAKDTFLANMSHEIRTPMNGVLMSLQLALDSDDLGDIHQLLETADTSCRSLLGIINGILDFSKLESGSVTIDDDAFSPMSLLRNARDLMLPSAQKKGLDFDLDLDPDLDPAPGTVLRGDPSRISQVLNNLISNAIKFTATGSVRLEATLRPAGDAPILYVQVHDTGPGVSADDQQHLFGRFKQLDRRASVNVLGTGLGLAISRQLVDLMAGRIGMTSDGCSGSRFWFEIPLKMESGDIQASGESADISTTGPNSTETQPTGLDANTRILLVEDNPLNQKLVTILLQKTGIKPDIAADGSQALDILFRDQTAYDVILMDNQMPRVTGKQATRLIRHSKTSAKDIPIIALTADVFEGQIAEFCDCGMDGFIGKPIDQSHMISEMERVLNTDRTADNHSKKQKVRKAAKTRLVSMSYISRCTAMQLDFQTLLEGAQKTNIKHGITGAMWKIGDYFVQTLEGAEDSVLDLLAVIITDPRHTDIRIVEDEVIKARRFPDWSMATPSNHAEILQETERLFGTLSKQNMPRFDKLKALLMDMSKWADGTDTNSTQQPAIADITARGVA